MSQKCFYCPKPFTSKQVRVMFNGQAAHMPCWVEHHHWPVECEDVTRPMQGVIRGVLIGAAIFIVLAVVVWLV